MSSSESESPAQAIVALCSILDELEMRYLIGGSFASSLHGDFRTTNDIDYLVHFSPGKLPGFLERLNPDFVFDEVAIRNAVQEQRSFNIFHEKTFLKIDVFTRIETYQREELKRAQKIKLPGSDVEVCVATPEDIILSKLAWYKLGNEMSDRQWRDILGVLKVQGDRIDLEYLHSQAAALELSALLDRVLKDEESI